MGIASLAIFTDILSVDIETLGPIFLPGVIIGSVLGFLTFGVVSLRTAVHSRSLGVLFIVLALLPVVNILSGVAGFEPTLTFAIVIGLALVNFAISYLLRNEDTPTGEMEVEPPQEPAT
jgi:Zn-dependent protease